MTLKEQARIRLGEAQDLYRVAGQRDPSRRLSALGQLLEEIKLMDDEKLDPPTTGAAILFVRTLRYRWAGVLATGEPTAAPPTTIEGAN